MKTKDPNRRCGGKMARYNIFISYRREGGFETAKLIFDCLIRKGYRAFFDMESMRSGKFNTQLYERIEQCRDFVVVFSAGSLQRERPREDDWFRLEIAHALKCHKNVIPVFLRGFEMPKRETLPEDIADVVDYQGVVASQELFDASLARLCRLLRSRPKIKWGLWGAVACVLILFLAAVLFLIPHFKRLVLEPQQASATPLPSAAGAVSADLKTTAAADASAAKLEPRPEVRPGAAENAAVKKEAAAKGGKSSGKTAANDPESRWKTMRALQRAGQREKAMKMLEELRHKHAYWLSEAAFRSAAVMMAAPGELPFRNGILILGYVELGARCPLKPGDVIVQIDGKDCGKLSDYNAANTRFVVYRLNPRTKKWRMHKTNRRSSWPELRLAMLPF